MLPISVIIPSYNSSKWLGECLESLIYGNSPGEIVIIDDCSTDNSYDLALNFSHKYQQISVFQTAANGGAAAARNLGFLNAKFDLVAVIDSDDLLEVGALQDAYDLFDDTVDLCIFQLWRYKSSEEKFKAAANPTNFPISGKAAAIMTLGGWDIHPLGISRKSLYLSAYQSIVDYGYNSDELVTRFLLLNARKIVGSKKRYFYRQNLDSTTSVLSEKTLKAMRVNIQLIHFAMSIDGAPCCETIRYSIATAFYNLRRKKHFNDFDSELDIFMKDFVAIKKPLFCLLFRPKSLLAFCILLAYNFVASIAKNNDPY